MEYVLQVFRHSDGAVNVHALFDKALDIRAMISDQLLTLNVQGRWSTRPVLSGNQLPSLVLADKAAAFVKKPSAMSNRCSARSSPPSRSPLWRYRAFIWRN